jgi:PEGA domain
MDRPSGIISLSWAKGQSVYPASESDASLLTGTSAGMLHLFTAFGMTSGTFTATPFQGGCRVLMRVTHAAYKTGPLYKGWMSLDSNNVLENLILNSLSKDLLRTPSGEPAVLSTANEKQSSLSITSLPSAGEIELDGAFVGTTPSQLSVRSGEHFISVRKDGYLLWIRKILVQPDSKISVHADLEKTGILNK